MKTFWKAALAALSITAFAGVAGSASAQPYGYDDYRYDGGRGSLYDPNYGADYGAPYDDYGYDQAPDGIPYDYASGGYCDEWGCPDDYYDMPIYYGSVYYGGSWFNGPLYYRDWGGSRQYWVHGGWHYDGWRGARPSWYREGRYGPALGRSFYSSNRFRGGYGYSQQYRGANNRGFDNRGNFNRPGFNRNDNRGFNGGNRNDFNNRGFRNDGNNNGSRFGNRSFAPQAQVQRQAAPQAQQQDRGQRFGNSSAQRQNFQRSDTGRADRGSFQRNNGGGNRDRGDRGGRNR